MGTPVPPEWPEIIDDKWYCAYWDRWAFNPPGPHGCVGVYLGRVNCCGLGAALNDWINNNKDCTVLVTHCEPPLCWNRLVAVHGPFDTRALCDAECH